MGTLTNTLNLSAIPNQKVAAKAHDILQQLSHGSGHHQVRGKRMHYDRSVISVPVGYRYRLLLLHQSGCYTAIDVMSHERYNKTKTLQKRIRQLKKSKGI